MDPYFLISVAILAIVGLFSFMLVTIVVLKLRRQVHDARVLRRRQALEPLVLEYGRGKDGSIYRYLEGQQHSGDDEPLQQILIDHIKTVRGSVRERLVRACEDLGLVDQAVRLLDSPQAWMRGAAAEDLGRMRSEKSVDALVQAMEDPVADVRIRSAQAIGAVGGRAAAGKLVTFFHQPDRWSGIRIADILASMGEETVDDIIREFPGIPQESRRLAIDVLGRVRSLSAVPLLRQLLRDKDENIRARAVDALGQIGDPSNTELLVQAVSDQAWQVRAVAAKALGRIAGNESVPVLCRALTDEQWWVRANAAEALKAKGEPGHQALLSMLDSEDAYAREQAVFMLEESGVLDSYIDQLNSKKSDDRSRALKLITKLVTLKRTARLGEVAQKHPNKDVREDLVNLLGLSFVPSGAPSGGTS